MGISVAVGHAVVIVAADGAYRAGGSRLTGPVDTVDKLATLVEWCRARDLLVPAGGLVPRVWIVGAAVGALVGPEVSDEQISRVLAPLVARGWGLCPVGPGRVALSRAGDADGPVEVMVDARPWLAGGELAVAEEAPELGRRLTAWVAGAGGLPDVSARWSAAVVLDEILAARGTRGRGSAVVVEPGALEVSLALPVQRWVIGLDAVQAAAFESGATDLVLLEQLHGLLASAGMVMLGSGRPTRLSGAAAAAAAAGAEGQRRRFGLWRAVLPSAVDLGLPPTVPLPHPGLRLDGEAEVWLSAEDLTGLSAAVRDGGAGIAVEQLGITEGVIWPHASRLLEGWAARVRELVQGGDPEVAVAAAVAAAAYLVGLGDPDGWRPGLERHYQPAWAAALAAHTRFRGRRAMMRIGREHRVWPLVVRDTSMVYAVGTADDAAPLDISDTHTRLGRHAVTARAAITDAVMVEALSAETPAELAAALTAPLHLAVPTAPEEPPADSEARSEAEVDATKLESASALDDQSAPAGGEKAARPAGRRAGKATAKVGPVLGGVPAAVLHTDGLWLADGRCVEVGSVVHVGQVAALAWEYQLGYRLSASWAEPGQIWLTPAICEAVGIDLAAISRRDPSTSLRAQTAELDFVTVATGESWAFGGGGDGPAGAGLGTWTRVFHSADAKRGVLVALMPGMGRRDMPMLADDPAPAQIARRLALLADALRFPWKIGAGTTAIDLLMQTRPRTYSPAQWRDEIWAPSTAPEPDFLADVEGDFDWSRPPTEAEAGMRYVHSYDRGGSYVSAAGGELPIGEPVHHPEGTAFDASVPGYWRIEIPDAADWRLPHLLNPRGRRFDEPKWVCTPRLERAIALGYEPRILEAYVWPRHARVLRGWYERLRDAATQLDTDDPDAQAARNQAKIVRVNGLGLMGSREYLLGRNGFSPERRWHVISAASANIVYQLDRIGQHTGRWPLAVTTDTVLYASDDPDPVSAWPGEPRLFGRGFGRYKPEGSALLAEHAEYLTGNGYRGRDALIRSAQWRPEAVAL
jgi:hypothetical protein